MSFLPYGQHWLDEEDVQAVVQVLRHGRLTQGDQVEKFEQAVASFTGARFAVAVSSGTAALHLACLALELGQGDVVITSANTFVASANCALYVGARPLFVDIERDTFNLSPQLLEKRLAALAGEPEQRPRRIAIIPVHFAGQPCDMAAIRRLAARHGCFVIEDACHALGATYLADGRELRVGACAHSDMAVFSFHPVKAVTTGEGGVITTNDAGLWQRLRRLQEHGLVRESEQWQNGEMGFVGGTPNPWYYEMQSLGYNYRITDIQSALGLSQLAKLERFVERRRAIARQYDRAFRGSGWLCPPRVREGVRSAYHLYPLQIDFSALGRGRAQVMQALRERGVGTQVHYIPVPLQPYYREHFGYQHGDFPHAEAYYQQALSIPIFPKMTDEDVGTVVAALNSLPLPSDESGVMADNG